MMLPSEVSSAPELVQFEREVNPTHRSRAAISRLRAGWVIPNASAALGEVLVGGAACRKAKNLKIGHS